MRLFGFTACLIVVLASTAAAGPVGLADSGTARGEHIAVGLEDAFPGWAHESTALADSVLAKIAAERDHWTEGLPAFVETLPTVDSEACTQDPATCQPMVASALVLIAACVAGAQQCGAFPDRMVDRPGNCPGSTPNEPDIMWAFGRPWLSDPVRSAFISAERYVPYGSYQVAVYTLSHP